MFNSCALFQTRVPVDLGKVCLDGEGRGKFEYLEKRYRFSYESKWDEEKKSWLMGLDIPIRGEMVVGYNMTHRSFFGQMFEELMLASRNSGKLDQFLMLERVWGEFLTQVLKCKKESCSFRVPINKSGYLQLKKEGYLLELFSEGGFYSRLRFRTGANLSENLTKTDLYFELVIKNCTLR